MDTNIILEFITADAIMPPDSNNNTPAYNEHEEEYYAPEPEPEEEPEEEPATEEEETEAPTEAQTEEPTEAATQAMTVAPQPTAEAHNGIFSNSLIQTLLIVVPILLAAVITVGVLLVVKNNKKQKAARSNMQNGSGYPPQGDPYQNNSNYPDDHHIN